MIKIIEAIFSLISFVILTSALVFTASMISFSLKKLLRLRVKGGRILSYSIFVGITLEIILSVVSIVFTPSIAHYNQGLDPGVISGFQKGIYITVLLSPVSSIIGSIMGASKNNPPWRRF